MKVLYLFLVAMIFTSCGSAQNKGMEIFESLSKEDQQRVLQQIQPPITYFFLKDLPFDGKANFENIDFLSNNVKSIKTIRRNYRIKKKDWNPTDFEKLENQGTIAEVFFDKNQKIIRATEYTAADGLTDLERFDVHYYGGDKIITRERRRGEIRYQYSDNEITVTDKSDNIYQTTEIENYIKSNDSLLVYHRLLPKPRTLKSEYVFNSDKLLVDLKQHHGGGINRMEFFYNDQQQVEKYIQLTDMSKLRDSEITKKIIDLSYNDFGGIKSATLFDETKNNTITNTANYSFKKDSQENLIIKIDDGNQRSEFHLDKNLNVIFCYRQIEQREGKKPIEPVSYVQIFEYY